MSWQAYIDSSLVGTGHIKRALICSHDGTPWAYSAGFNPSNAELKALIKGFADNAGIQGSGINLQGTKYMTLRADNRSIYGKKGAGGVVSVKTGQAVIIGIYEEGTQPGQATTVVEKLADYLIENGY
ncbi:MAG: profilin [Ardenticatenaceae bacterium]|nr:profilin [Ardenticatenaceae bacterium]